jgi:Zn-dependent protease with chaperone function
MIVPYVLRLLCLCLATFFLVNALLSLTASIASRAAVRIAETMRPRTATRFLFTLRLLPLTLGVSTVLGLCVPSYLWLEPEATPERVGWACLALALLGAVSWSFSIARAARAVAASAHCNRMWLRAGHEARLRGESSNAVIVEKEAPLLALAGVYRPRLMVSESVLRALSADQLAVALHHENAHRGARDNLKRLLLLLAPNPIPFVHEFSLLEQAWAKFTEWAADDDAVQGDSRRALSLAEALLRVARMGAGPRLSFLLSSFVAGDGDLSARVDRLLRIEPTGPILPSRTRFLTLGAGLGMGACMAILLAWPPILSSVHRLLELFLH